jgi:hypothetical protein
MKSVVIGSTVYANGSNRFSLESAQVTGIQVVHDLDRVKTLVNLWGDDEERSVTADVFFSNYTDVFPFFRLGFTYKNKNNSEARFKITELLKADNPYRGKGLFAVAKRTDGDGTDSYIILDESGFSFMVQV